MKQMCQGQNEMDDGSPEYRQNDFSSALPVVTFGTEFFLSPIAAYGKLHAAMRRRGDEGGLLSDPVRTRRLTPDHFARIS
jgi:hypothetical protein